MDRAAERFHKLLADVWAFRMQDKVYLDTAYGIV